MEPKRIAFLGFDEVNALDLVGPIEAFDSARVESSDGPGAGYTVSILGLTKRPFRSESGLVLKPHGTLSSPGEIDTLIVPGGRGLRDPEISSRIAAWIGKRAARIRRVASVCTGIYGLAPTGLLDGRRVTTHWRWARRVAGEFPALRMEPNALYVKDGPFYTSAGITRRDRPCPRPDRGGLRPGGRPRRGSGDGRVRQALGRPGTVFRTLEIPG